VTAAFDHVVDASIRAQDRAHVRKCRGHRRASRRGRQQI